MADDTQDYTYDEVHNAPIRDIVNGVAPEDTTPPVEETPVEEEVPLEKVVEDTTRKVLDEVEAKRQVDEQARIAAETPQPSQDDEYLAWAKQFEEDNNKTPNWVDAAKFLEDRAVARIEARKTERDETERVAQETAQKEQDAITQQVNTVVDDELQDLYTSGKLTKIKDPDNPSDQGVIERKSLFQTWMEVNQQRTAEGKPQIISATRIANSYWKKPNAQPAGANAPIAGNRGSGQLPQTDADYSYSDLKKPWSFLKRG